MVRELPVSVYERVVASGACVYDLKDRICSWVSEDVEEEGVVPAWVPCHWDAY